MSQGYRRNKPQGLAHRAILRALVLPHLALGAAVPTGKELARLLRIHESEAHRHMRRVLDEEGITTEARGAYGHRRVWVVGMPERRAAA